ncbi:MULTISPECIES: ankyrin repeat domain-containing protein [Sphingobium]|jgi:ankyrin repeat protein|uniref:Uncharacterized protein n=1 Tax=Sphingobium lactosutens DS20 TaxID=1331060 RepID=T0HCW0_9SPHN|nr:ankyrin repeat domain-containing protein [Sphingobium lactosutens]EQB10802.1 hypothetical protein RLDS_25540 [Sphingobium lactosutens DS20]
MLTLFVASLLAAATAAPASSPTPVELPSPARRQELLYEAARLGRADMIEPLAKAGVNLDGYDARGFTALILAAYNGHDETVDALIKAGADACRPDETRGNTAQMGVAFKGDDVLAARLLRTPCGVDVSNKAGQTALMMAAMFGREAQIDMLLAAGASPDLTDLEGRGAKSIAAMQGHTAIVNKLARR